MGQVAQVAKGGEVMAEMQCDLCGAVVPNVEAAIKLDWVAEFYDTSKDDPEGKQHGPACGTCARVYLIEGADGELETRRFIGVA